MSHQSISLWGADTGKTPPHMETPEVQEEGALTVATEHKWDAIKNIRWGAMDAFVGMVLLLVLQALVVGVVLIQDALKNPDALAQEDFSAVLSPALMLVSALSMYAAWGFSILWASKRKGFNNLAKDFLVRFKWKHDIIFAIVATIILRITEQIVGYIVVDVIGLNIESSDNAGTVAAQEGIWWFINALLVAAFLAPIFEELFFRGLFLQGVNRTLHRLGNKQRSTKFSKDASREYRVETFAALRKFSTIGKRFIAWVSRHSMALSLAISSTVFGFMHWPGTFDAGAVYLVCYTGALGVILGFIVLKYKRLGPAILTHILFNMSGVILSTVLN